MAVTVDELIKGCLSSDDDFESLNKWGHLFYDQKTDSYYKIRTYEVRYDYKTIQKELEGTGFYLNAILDLDFCFPQYKKARFHLYKLSKIPSDITIITYKGDWNKIIKQVMKSPEFKRMALTKDQRDYLDNVLTTWLSDNTPATNSTLYKIEVVDGKSIIKISEESGEEINKSADENISEASSSDEVNTELNEIFNNNDSIDGQKDNIDNDDPYQTGCHFYYDEKDVQKAVYYFTEAANNGDMDAQYILGTIYFKGELGSKDYDKSIKYFEMAAEQNDADSEHWLGWIYYNGYGVDKDIDMAIKWYEVAAKEGLADAQYNYGCLYHMDSNPKRDDNKALKWLKRAEKRGDKRASLLMNIIKSTKVSGGKEEEPDEDAVESDLQNKYKTAVDYLKGNTDEQGIKTAIQYLTEASEAGHSSSQIELGLLYMKGEHVVKDIEKAKQYLIAAFNNGRSMAGIHLAMLYLESTDPAEVDYAIDLLNEAKDKGSPKAAMILAKMYMTGDKVSRDINNAIAIYREQANAGNTDAQLQMGLVYYHGNEVIPKDVGRAISWFTHSAENNNPVAMENLGVIYLDGQIVKKNTAKAKYWFEEAKKNGSKNADTYIGWMKYKGIENDVDYNGAEDSLLNSADFGNAMAMELLGDLYLTTTWEKYNPESAVEWYIKAAERGRTNCFVKLGKLFIEGEHTKQNVSIGFQWLDRAINDGQINAYYIAGDIYFNGKGVTQDLEKAASFFQIGSDKGDRNSTIMLSKMYHDGIYFDKDEEKSAELLESIKVNDPEMIYQSALKYRTGNSAGIEREKEIELLIDAADKGHMKAQYELGQMYFTGDSLPKDMELAEKYTLMSANQGYPPAEYALYSIVKDNDKEVAMEWLRRSVEHEHPEGIIKYAKFLIKKPKNDDDISQAIDLLEKATDQGHEEALVVLASIYLDKPGYIDEKKGINLLQIAIDHGNVRAALDLGKRYISGKGVEKNGDLAVKNISLTDSASGYFKLYREYRKGNLDLDDDTAFDCLLRAAELGSITALYEIKQVYLDKSKNQLIDEKAFKCFHKLSLEGNKRAQDLLAQCYLAGKGVEKDPEKAEEWFLEALNDNQNTDEVRIIYRHLALMYKKSKTEESMKKTFEYFKKSAELGDSMSMVSVAGFYLKGKIVDRDLDMVKYWVNMAENNNPKPDVKIGIERIRQQMDDMIYSEMED